LLLAAALIELTTRCNSSVASPSSRMNAAAMYKGFAPLIAKSLTVPLIAN
jgi:hypothetical protein